MKVTVSFRDVEAKQKFEAAKTEYQAELERIENKKGQKKKNATKPEQPVWKGFTTEQLEGLTVEDLKTNIAWKLSSDLKASGFDFELKPKDVWVFKENADGELSRMEKDDEPLQDTAKYYAVEVFDVLPTIMYRTVRLDEIEPATLCLPEKQGLTDVSPFKTAAMSRGEFAFPWYGLSENEFHVNGISVFANDKTEKITDKDWNPFDSASVKNVKGMSYSISKDDYRELARTCGYDPDSSDNSKYGILKTPLSHESDKFGVIEKDFKVKKVNTSGPKVKGEATEQVIYFRFALEKGTDLSKHGMAAVLDNLGSEGHCSLVRLEEEQDEAESWIYYEDGIGIKESFSAKLSESEDDQTLTQMLSPTKTKQPEYLKGVKIGGVKLMVFPCLAATFHLHDFVVQARAEPLPLENFDDDNAQDMYSAVSYLFSIMKGEDVVYDAIERLEAADYDVDSIDISFRKTLYKAMEKADTCDDDYGLKVLDRGMGILRD